VGLPLLPVRLEADPAGSNLRDPRRAVWLTGAPLFLERKNMAEFKLDLERLYAGFKNLDASDSEFRHNLAALYADVRETCAAWGSYGGKPPGDERYWKAVEMKLALESMAQSWADMRRAFGEKERAEFE